MTLPPLSIYIHIPWCIKKCPYCDFNSYAKDNAYPEDLPEEAYIEALLQDLQHDVQFVQGREIKSIFFGGGTPSLFSAQGIEQILNSIAGMLTFSPNIEITLEANPGTVEHKSFKDYRNAGLNRISLGVQSFQDDKLKVLGRIHSSLDTQAAIGKIIQAGFDSFNIDLMYGLPQQSIADAMFDLKKALEYSPPHLSWYNLTIEPNTIFHQKPPKLPTEDALWEMQQAGQLLLETHGIKQYEVSAYATPNHQCQHNLNYWEFGDYLGIGAGAHSKLTTISGIGPKTKIAATKPEFIVHRLTKTRYPKSYLAANESIKANNRASPFLAGNRIIPTTELPFEFMLNALRLSNGFPAILFSNRTALDLQNIQPLLDEAINKGLLSVSLEKVEMDPTFIPTDLGKRFLNDLVALFLT